jgi:hypothetical protein
MSSLPFSAALAERLPGGMQQWKTHGWLDFRVDGRIRVRMQRGRRDGEVLVQTRLGPLPSAEREREALLTRIMLHVTAGAAHQVGTIALSADGEQLWLQAGFDGAEPLDDALEAFLNEVGCWTALLRAQRP